MEQSLRKQKCDGLVEQIIGETGDLGKIIDAAGLMNNFLVDHWYDANKCIVFCDAIDNYSARVRARIEVLREILSSDDEPEASHLTVV